jgi:hypothetical protein
MLLAVPWLIARLRVHRNPLKSQNACRSREQYQTKWYRINVHYKVNKRRLLALSTVLTVTLLTSHCAALPARYSTFVLLILFC